MTKTHYFYQIDYINAKNEANYIKSFTSTQRNKAIKHVNILNEANQCLNCNTYFVLDKYASEDYDGETDRIVEENITNAKPLNSLSSREKMETLLSRAKHLP